MSMDTLSAAARTSFALLGWLLYNLLERSGLPSQTLTTLQCAICVR